MTRRLIHWFRRDLRLDDNTGLIAALERADEVVPVFILDPTILRRPDTAPARLAFLAGCLEALDGRLKAHGSGLVVREGDPAAELVRLAAEVDADGVTFNRCYEPYARERDRVVRAGLTAAGRAADDLPDLVLHEPGTILVDGERPYTAYAPYRRRALERLAGVPAPIDPAPLLHRLAPAAALPPGRTLPAPPPGDRRLPAPGEAAALARLRWFAGGAIDRYATDRDRPAIDGTSRLSPYLKLGALSVRRCLAAAQAAMAQAAASDGTTGPAAWLGELIWRDFFYDVLYHFPRVEAGSFRAQFAALPWAENDDHLAAWMAGRTGYPIVDAGMRQLAAEGWLHNRVRLIVGAFLCKDLLLDWRAGERHFMRSLVDGDLALNNGNWQWVASTGTDAQPFFRIVNPTSQGRRYDPDGAYVRRYVPELARVPAAFIHTPWQMPADLQPRAGCRIGLDYPAPIVDHAAQRERALALYRAARRR
jgi:deoxyribodipyrimidine photo-lyase